jgi:hypothetical protein
MSKHHPLGRRTQVFSLRLHTDERAQLLNLAARQGMQPADFARHRALEMALPPLPNPLALDRVQAAAELRLIEGALRRAVTFVSNDGPVNWKGQIEVAHELYDLLLSTWRQVDALRVRIQRPG